MENEVLDDKSNVLGQIYLIKNTTDGKGYVGQTVTHRKNREKYKPFGYQGRFKDHVSEALCNTKKKQCRYLNNAIRHYGKDIFTVNLLHTCVLSELDMWEKHYIIECNTMYPNGYNLTNGGKAHRRIEAGDEITTLDTNMPSKRGGCLMRTEETRQKMSERLRTVMGTDENRKRQMFLTKEQHKSQKVERFKNEKIDLNNLDKYIYIKHSHGTPYVVVRVNDKRTSFVGKYETLEQLQLYAKEFLTYIATIATLPN